MAENGTKPTGGWVGGDKDGSQQKEKKEQQEEQRRQLLVQILAPDARERLARIHLVKPDKAMAAEDYLLMMAKSGRLRERVSEDMLIQFLEQVSKQEQSQPTKIVVMHRGFEEEELDLDSFGI